MAVKRAAPYVVLLLLMMGAICVGLRKYTRRDVGMKRGDSVWRLTYKIDFRAKKNGAKLHVALPLDTNHSRVMRHELQHPGLKTERLRTGTADIREVSAIVEQPGEYHLQPEFDIHLSPKANWRNQASKATLSATQRAKYLQSENTIQVTSRTVTDTLERLRGSASTKNALVDQIFQYCQTEIGPGGLDAPQDAAGVLQEHVASATGLARTMVALCRAAKIPARLVTGFEVRHGVNLRPIVWVEVLTNGHWEPFDPDNGYARELPARVLPVRCGAMDIVRGSGIADLRATFSMDRLSLPSGELTPENRRPIDILDLTRLPLEMHEVVALMLLLPLGALVTSVARILIGIRTFGTFSPTLLALSFIYADWRTGLIIFVTVIIMGLASRSLLERLKLLLIPRLSVVLTLVVLVMIFCLSVLDYFSMTPSAQAVLLPMVIMTMTVERFYVTSEEDGSRFALLLLSGTLLVAFCCYLTLRWETLGRLLLIYPEAHLFTIAVLILLGRYTGYRLTELWRFRDLVQTAP